MKPLHKRNLPKEIKEVRLELLKARQAYQKVVEKRDALLVEYIQKGYTAEELLPLFGIAIPKLEKFIAETPKKTVQSKEQDESSGFFTY